MEANIWKCIYRIWQYKKVIVKKIKLTTDLKIAMPIRYWIRNKRKSSDSCKREWEKSGKRKKEKNLL